MSQGRFSSPRPHREEEREIEKAYRDLTRKQSHKTYEHKVTAEDIARAEQPLPTQLQPEDAVFTAPDPVPVPSPEAEDRQIEDAFRQVTGQKVAPRGRVGATFDVPTEEPEFQPKEKKPAKKSAGQPLWLGEVMEFYQQNSKLVLAALCAVSVMVIVFVILLFARSAKDPYDGKILNNVHIADVNVGGMTKTEAVSTLNMVFGDAYATEDMVIDISGTKLTLTKKDSGISFEANGAVEEAYAYGRTGTQSERDAAFKASKTQTHNIAVLPYLNLKTANIREFLTDKAGKPGNTLVQSTYGLEGAEPELSAEKFDNDAPTQTLVITIGKPGVGFDPEEVYNQVLDAYSQRVFLVTVENVETLKEPDPIDLDRIYKEYCVEPVNASVNPTTGKTIPGTYGYTFDKEAAQKLLDNAQFGEVLRIPMEYVKPDIVDASSFYQDILGEYKTKYFTHEKRTENLRLACEGIDGRILNPGESFSFLDAVNRLDPYYGFKSAPDDTDMDDISGGGAVQVSSTLYCAALLSDLTIIEGKNMKYLPSFVKEGFDADTNLIIKNPLPYPVRINAQISNGYVKVSILGTEQRDYYRKLGSDIVQTYKAETEYQVFPYPNAEDYEDGDVLRKGRDGYQIKSYTIRYDRLTDQWLSSDSVATSTYNAITRIVASVVTPEETTSPTQSTESTDAATQSTEGGSDSDSLADG